MMPSISESAQAFFEACERGKGWNVCKDHCEPDATFASQAEPIAGITTLQQYVEWMQGLLTILTDATYEVKAFATDDKRKSVIAYAVITGTHLAGGPCPPTGKRTKTDYVYVMQFEGAKIAHMTKIWNSSHTLKELGWS